MATKRGAAVKAERFQSMQKFSNKQADYEAEMSDKQKRVENRRCSVNIEVSVNIKRMLCQYFPYIMADLTRPNN